MDRPLRVTELAVRQVYWRSAGVRAMLSSARQGTESPAPPIQRNELLARLEELGVRRDGLVMVHSSLNKMRVVSERPQGPVLQGMALGTMLLRDLQALVGDQGTIVMPTHPAYLDDPGFMHDKRHLVHTFDPARTPSRVGLLGELFRRQESVQRSFHPLSSLAARGPLADALLRDNLNDREPLPHGADSGYFRFCRARGAVVCINTPIIHAMSIAHTAEEVRDRDWPVPGFFYVRRFQVRTPAGLREWRVRERHPLWARYISLGQLRRDLLREGIIRETRIGDVRIDAADSRSVLEYMLERNARKPYPYHWIRRRSESIAVP